MHTDQAGIEGYECPHDAASHPMRTLAALSGGALAVVLLLLSGAATGRAPTHHPALERWFAPSDTDSVGLDLLRADSIEGGPEAVLDAGRVDTTDTLEIDTVNTPRANFYIPSRRRETWTASPVQRRRRPFHPRMGNYWTHEVELDSTENAFTIREYVGRIPVRYPLTLSSDEYRSERLEADLDVGWRDLIEQRARQRANERRGGLGFNIVVPGGQQSAFTTIFGRPSVDLRVNGQADIKAGFDYRKSDQQVAVTGNVSQIDPDFKQDLRLGITGTIGDKLRVDVNWDTNNQFDFQNQLRLQYQGYEDEIIQSVEAGNVNLSTPSRLIRGGQSLFGIKSELRLGGLQLTTVASQQEGQSSNLSIEGGSQTTEFDLKPTDYDDNTHYFLGYYFRNRWEEALSEPPTVRVANGFESITDIEVWRLLPTSPEEENVRRVVAMVDLGEPEEIITEANGYGGTVLPGSGDFRYSPEVLQDIRDPNTTLGDYMSALGLGDSDYQPGRFKKLRQGADYEFDDVLGYISLNQRLQEGEALAIAFRYRAGGATYQVGDFAGEGGGSSGGQNSEALALKLLKPTRLQSPAPASNFNPAAWYLELRNIYSLPGRGLNPDEFELQIQHQPPGRSGSKVVPDLAGSRQRTLLQLLGLDKLNEDGSEQPDDRFDYLRDFTIDPTDGELIFPYLEPFGGRIERIIDELEDPAPEKERKRGLYAYNGLYTMKKENADDQTQFDVYRIRGSYKGTVQDFYDLRAFSGLVEGSVSVTSGGSRLTEGTDYVVDYQGGTVTITNPAYLTAGRDIQIDYEQNSFFNIQKKTLLGARADYVFSDNLALGGTIFNLNQKSPIDKFRIGEEPISNTIWGLDGALDLQPQWLTRAVDALPFIQTRAPSAIRITGEFAQLRPGASETVAFERSRRRLADQGRDFKSDELSGISYLDDFEGFENTYSLKQPGAWRLTAPPDSIGPYPGTLEGSVYDSLRTNWKGVFGWYSLNENILADLLGGRRCAEVDPAVCNVHINEVFPNQDTRGDTHPFITPLDVYFTPHQRGPYNYMRDLKGFMNAPSDVWGGMVQRLPDGYTDFSTKNIEFIEFVIKPYPDGRADAGRDANLYVDLGSISEDIIPNGDINTEDGLLLGSVAPGTLDEWSRATSSSQNSTVDVDDASRRTEDLGLDGLASYSTSEYEPAMTEQNHFQGFLASLDEGDPDPQYQAEVRKAMRDPSGDDFFYFGASEFFDNPDYYPEGANIQERFSHYFPGTEVNSFEAQNKLAPSIHGRRGNSRLPDTEDMNNNSSPDVGNSYFQYRVPLSHAVLDSMAVPGRADDYVVTEITSEDGQRTGWYQIRIPVREYTRRVGDISNFNQIESIRVWTTGHQVPMTVRFATFELVGAQWKKSEDIALERETVTDTTHNETILSVSSINNEENSDTYVTPRGTIISQNRLATGSVQNAREQAMVLRLQNLMPGKQRAIFKTYNQELDLLKYSNLRMFTHMHGELRSGEPIESRDKALLFLRLGSNETNDYYEYEMPLTPSSLTSGDPDQLWQTHQTVNGEIMDLNSVNLLLGALNQLKVARDEVRAHTDSVYWTDENQVPLSPGIEDFAPPGTRLGIKGSPSLGRVNTIVIGVRNGADSTLAGLATNARAEDIIEDVTVWVNELRVSGYDETNGWAAMANADIQLADLGSIKASWQSQTDGFGGLESTLGERDQTNLANWSITTDVNLDKFIPERFGWTIPFSMQFQSNTRTPRFSPSRGDIRLEEIVSQIEENENLSEAERAQAKQEAIEAAQTASVTQSFTTRIQKTGSDSKLLRNTLDGLSVNYSFSNSAARNPSQHRDDAWRWTSGVTYRLNVRRPKTVRPFWFLESLPILGILGDLDFNYVPQSISAGATAARNYSATKDRPRALPIETDEFLPDPVQFPLRQTHALSHRRNAGFQYNPFQFLNLSYSANTNQSLNALGVDTLFTVIRVDSLGAQEQFPNLTLEDAYVQGRIDSSHTAYEVTELDVISTQQVVNRIFSGHEGLRNDQHQADFTASFRPNLSRHQALNWISIQDIVYGSEFRWQNGAVGRNTGANISNRLELRGGLTLRPQELFRKIPFYRSLEEAQEASESEREAERRRREAEREAERLAREQERAAGEEAEDPEPTHEPSEAEDPGRTDEPSEAEDPARTDEPSEAEDDGGGFELPLPDPISLLRRTVLAVTGVRDFTVTYSANRTSSSSNVGRGFTDSDNNLIDVASPYSLIDAILGNGPPVGYRFGFDRHVPLSQRIVHESLQVTDVLNNGHTLQGRTALNPSQALQINLTWNANWDAGTNYTYRREGGIHITTRTSGTNRASVWAFGADYLDLFKRQLDTYRGDVAAKDNASTRFGDEDGNGRIALTNQSIVQDFQETFLSGLGTIDGRGLLPFPMPNWQVTYSGIGNWPLIRNLVNSATLRHGYGTDYNTDFRVNPSVADSMRTYNLAGDVIEFALPRNEVGGLRVNERFQPLVGVDLSFRNRLQTSIAWNLNTAYSLSTTNFELSQSENSEMSFTASYQQEGLKLPFVERLNNRISFGLTVSRAKINDLRFSVRNGIVDYINRVDEFVLEDAVTSEHNVTPVTASTRVTVVPRISYQFSNTVSADFTLRYENFASDDNRQPSSTSINGGFNVRVSIAN